MPPFPAEQPPIEPHPAPTDRTPVVLVHGMWDTCSVFNKMTTSLQKQGWTVYSLDLIPANGDASLEDLAQQLQTFVEANLPADRPFDLVGFSMGGIVSRYYLQRLGGLARVQRFVTIASPHQGTLIAYGSLRPGSIQMRPNSAFLNGLNEQLQQLADLNFTSIWTPFDAMIVPAHSSVLPIAHNVSIPVLVHAWMVSDDRVITAVRQALQEDLRSLQTHPQTEPDTTSRSPICS
ncbi:esterase/lipase family protein [Alkalinema pantanalense CENA528]|uniref:esterase/lipase family protein n=1 Tax=Alkalinema pantanalense TaxID=1620705 RepID=UPI003D6E8318